VRLGIQKPGSLDLARFIDQDAQCLAGTVQTMIEQGRKGRFERMMFHALGHQVDSFVGDQNRYPLPGRPLGCPTLFGRERPHRYGQPRGAAPTG
jgi:hypothetical protein